MLKIWQFLTSQSVIYNEIGVIYILVWKYQQCFYEVLCWSFWVVCDWHSSGVTRPKQIYPDTSGDITWKFPKFILWVNIFASLHTLMLFVFLYHNAHHSKFLSISHYIWEFWKIYHHKADYAKFVVCFLDKHNFVMTMPPNLNFCLYCSISDK